MDFVKDYLCEKDEVGTISMFSPKSITSKELKNEFENEFCSYGGSRLVIDFDDVVMKLPTCYSEVNFDLEKCENLFEVYRDGYRGFEQMITEWYVWENCPEEYRHWLCPILDYGFLDNGVPYTIMKRANILCEHSDDIEEGIYHSGNSGISRPSYADESGEWYEEMDLFEFLESKGINLRDFDFDTVVELCDSCGISDCDFLNNYSNVGEIDGKPSLIDYGWGLDSDVSENLINISVISVLNKQSIKY